MWDNPSQEVRSAGLMFSAQAVDSVVGLDKMGNTRLKSMLHHVQPKTKPTTVSVGVAEPSKFSNQKGKSIKSFYGRHFLRGATLNFEVELMNAESITEPEFIPKRPEKPLNYRLIFKMCAVSSVIAYILYYLGAKMLREPDISRTKFEKMQKKNKKMK